MQEDPFEEFPLLPAEEPDEPEPELISNRATPVSRVARQPDPIREQSLERSLPNSAEAERAILGGIILDNGLIAQAIELLRPEDFYIPSHRRIFVAMTVLFERNTEINPILIGEELKKEHTLESVGGISFITNLTYGLPHSTNIAHYAKVIRGMSMVRQLIATSSKITQEALEMEDDPDTIFAHAVKGVMDLADEQIVESLHPIGTVADDLMALARENAGHGVLVTGIRTGLTDLDQRLGGLQRQHLIIIAARPSMGKTSLALCIAENIAIANLEMIIIIFSLEMSKEELAMRLLCSRARVDSMRFRDGILSSQEWDAMGRACDDLRNARIIIDDSFNNTPIRIRAKCKRVQARYGRIDLVVVDYLQLMVGSDKRGQSREQDVSDNSRDLKGLAKDLNCPVAALSQLNRKPEDRPNKRPQLADLRESGALEQNADEVVFIFREAWYQRQAGQPVSDENLAELIVAKARSGRTGPAAVRFEERITRFENLATDNP